MIRLGEDRSADPSAAGLDVTHDQLVIIRIDGLHCHQCELAIQDALGREDGVHEVEVDFLSGQCSVLIDPAKAQIETLKAAIEQAGYRPGETSVGGAGVEA